MENYLQLKKIFFGLVLSLTLLITNCKVTPLYSEGSAALNPDNLADLQREHPFLKNQLAGILLDEPKDRFEQYLYKELNFLLYNANNSNLSSKIYYQLHFSGSYETKYLGDINVGEITAHQGRSTLAQIIGRAHYQLSFSEEIGKNISYQSPVFYSQTSLYRSANSYANLIEEQEAHRRVAQDLANIILMDLAQHLVQEPKGPLAYKK